MKAKFQSVLVALRPKNIVSAVALVFKTIYLFICFFLMIVFIIFGKFFRLLRRIPIIGKGLSAFFSLVWNPQVNSIYLRFFALLEASRYTEVKRSYLINLALKNLLAKKTRTFITILGMSVGVGIIVLLLSLGYGIEQLVISKVATLNELRIIDVSMGDNSVLHLDQNFVKKIQGLKNVQKVVPLISMVGKVNYNKATTDTIAYATTKEYFDYSKLKLTQGKLFSQVGSVFGSSQGEVAGISTSSLEDASFAETITGKNVDFNINPDEVAPVWVDASMSSNLFGYTPRIDGGYQGVEYWGDMYAPFMPYGRVAYDSYAKKFLGKWIRARVPIYTKMGDGSVEPLLTTIGQQIYKDAFIPEKNIQIIATSDEGKVLGVSTQNDIVQADQILGVATASNTVPTDQSASYSASVDQSATSGLFSTVSASSSSELEVVSVVATSAATMGPKLLTYTSDPSKIAVVSTGMLNLLSISPKNAIGSKFKASFIITKSLKPDLEGRGITSEIEYEVQGVVDDPKLTFFYVPMSDMDKLGIGNFSQIKVILSNKDVLPVVRKEIESLGFHTSSTVDTVAQIESLFANLLILLGLLGMVALGVASLGMFNTLTVSLLERTREIGGMKTMGVISNEVQDLFLAEAMILGLGGGTGGLLLGYLIGNFLSFLVSIVAIAHGQGYLQLTTIPLFLSTFIIIASFFVGLVTGLYPAQRAKKISALNALRYE